MAKSSSSIHIIVWTIPDGDQGIPGIEPIAVSKWQRSHANLTYASQRGLATLFRLYQWSIAFSWPRPKNEIDKFVVGLDEYCLQWTAIWYSAIQSDAIDSWTPDNQVRFESRRVVMIAILKRDLLLVTPK